MRLTTGWRASFSCNFCDTVSGLVVILRYRSPYWWCSRPFRPMKAAENQEMLVAGRHMIEQYLWIGSSFSGVHSDAFEHGWNRWRTWLSANSIYGLILGFSDSSLSAHFDSQTKGQFCSYCRTSQRCEPSSAGGLPWFQHRFCLPSWVGRWWLVSYQQVLH